jgi:hypothetical protein
MNNSDIQGHIEQLIADETALRDKSEHSPEDRKRIAEIEIELDRLWDLLRQRRARQEFGQSVEDTAERPAGVVENYQQ